MAKGRTNPGDVANLMVRCLLSDASELLGGWTDTDRERTLRYFEGRCAYTGVSYDPATFVWDRLIPHNQVACGLHVYGNLVPATRAANSAKAAKDFRVFLREDHACLGDLTAEERETRIRRLEDFMRATDYAAGKPLHKHTPDETLEENSLSAMARPGFVMARRVCHGA